jgi:pyroglutamyl-peptidase
MRSTLLLTSFTTWLPHQKSNTSDDLLEMAIDRSEFSPSWQVLRQLPVESQAAIDRVVSRLERLQPTGVICCGMAEKYPQMKVEIQATCGDTILRSPVNIGELMATLKVTGVSENAGRFVCNDLYYGILNYIRQQQRPISCLFVHIPLLSSENTQPILKDFLDICRWMANS